MSYGDYNLRTNTHSSLLHPRSVGTSDVEMFAILTRPCSSSFFKNESSLSLNHIPFEKERNHCSSLSDAGGDAVRWHILGASIHRLLSAGVLSRPDTLSLIDGDTLPTSPRQVAVTSAVL